ncbi:MAG: hypothetical protein HUU50_09720 [Candidatus Brocadiae bacterium]|nr:hypothetical protein [Candidatus Brocadiia bacterium]
MKKLLLKLNQNITAIQITSQSEGVSKNIGINTQQEDEKQKQIERENIYQEGYQKGIEDAIHALQEPIQKVVLKLENESRLLQQKWAAFLQELEPKIASLILKITEQILQKERTAGNYDIEKIARNVIEEIKAYPDVHILELHCHPDDMALWQNHIDHAQGIHFLCNPQIPKSDCVIHTNLGKILVSWEDRYKQIEKLLQEN